MPAVFFALSRVLEGLSRGLLYPIGRKEGREGRRALMRLCWWH